MSEDFQGAETFQRFAEGIRDDLKRCDLIYELLKKLCVEQIAYLLQDRVVLTIQEIHLLQLLRP